MFDARVWVKVASPIAMGSMLRPILSEVAKRGLNGRGRLNKRIPNHRSAYIVRSTR